MSAVWGPFVHEPDDVGISRVQEVILEFNENVPSGNAINIQTGAYAGQVTPPTLTGDTLTLLATFDTDPTIQVVLNGQELKKPEDVVRVSSTQISLVAKIKTDYILKVRIFS